ncbi:uncharacterized protein JN550_003096 [Neoarthrinium moseri]|uniref:uncharacterized protein n=1 Tax=Neoarthrinium moseri TaxID=1658444 RepID=UPI001FDD01EA|nr:uncharacterized protein JN550_003096 [Neoarthrinium moseri]KAI1873827.1 hypothetical protein JN550_003096 [Neoarthrinium moseri]
MVRHPGSGLSIMKSLSSDVSSGTRSGASSSRSAMAAAPSTQWASSSDWDAHRATITDMYEAQGMKLREVMKIMQEKHHFYATARMYKARFQKWGLQKTLRFEQVGELLRLNMDHAGVGKPSTRLIRGKPVDEKRLRTYLRNLPPEKHELLAKMALGSPEPAPPTPPSVVSCRTPSPGPSISHLFYIPPPDDLRMPEECIATMRAYVDESLATGLWSLNPNEVLRAGALFSFWNLGRTAKRLLKAGQTKQAFRVLQSCFHAYRALLAAQSPLLFLYTYVVCLFFADGYPSLYMSFLKYITDLSSIVYAVSHPLHVLFKNMYLMGPLAARTNVACLTQSYMDFCRVSPDSMAMIDVEGFLSLHFAGMGLHDWKDAEATLRRLLTTLELHRGVEAMEAVYLDARDDLASMVMHQGRFDEARDIIRESLKSPVLQRYPLLHASCYRNLFLADRDQGLQEEAIESGYKVVKFTINLWGMSDSKTITVLSDLRNYLREIGRDEMADKLNEDCETAINELNKDLEDIDLTV